MSNIVVMSLALTLTAAENIYVWTEWSGSARCLRSCSRPSGYALYHRTCMKCKGELCKTVDGLYCDGRSEKNETCYVGSQCSGEGLYRGQWTEWSSLELCPSLGDRCKGDGIVSFRRCVLAAVWRGRRPEIAFRCPGGRFEKKVQPCPCQASAFWSSWSRWSVCPPTDGGVRRRRRICIRLSEAAGCTRDVASSETASCPIGDASAGSARSRVRRLGEREMLKLLQNDMMRRDPKKSFLNNLPRGSLPVAFLLMLSLTALAVVILVLRMRYLKWIWKKRAKKAYEQLSAEQDKEDKDDSLSLFPTMPYVSVSSVSYSLSSSAESLNLPDKRPTPDFVTSSKPSKSASESDESASADSYGSKSSKRSKSKTKHNEESGWSSSSSESRSSTDSSTDSSEPPKRRPSRKHRPSAKR